MSDKAAFDLFSMGSLVCILVAFPTAMDMHVAFHAALMRSGWNPSTLLNGIDATQPGIIFQHPKNPRQTVLAVEDEVLESGGEGVNPELLSMTGRKSRAGGRLQFCVGLKKDPDSPPNIVASVLERTKELREQLSLNAKTAEAKYRKLQLDGSPIAEVERQFKQLLKFQEGTRKVWLYVDYRGDINWLDAARWSAFYAPKQVRIGGKRVETYLEYVIRRLNIHREARGEDLIATVTPSDLRDIYARWVSRTTNVA